MKTRILESDIDERIEVCPYCMESFNGWECCGENHKETAFLVNGTLHLESEVEIIKPTSTDLLGVANLVLKNEGVKLVDLHYVLEGLSIMLEFKDQNYLVLIKPLTK